MRKLTGSCSWAGTTQPDSTWTLERDTEQDGKHTHTHTRVMRSNGETLMVCLPANVTLSFVFCKLVIYFCQQTEIIESECKSITDV